MGQKLHLGLDVGSVSLNTALINQDQEILFTDYTRTKGRPFEAALAVLARLFEAYALEDIATISVTGSGGKVLAGLLGGVFVNEVIAQSRAAALLAPQARTIIDMGGEDSKIIYIKHRQGRPLVADFAMNSMCAAGTGSFLDQQAHRLGYTIEEFGELALKSETPPRLAGRCSVFAKTDMIHLQQGAVPDYEIIAGLCQAMVRNLKGNIAKGKPILPPVSFQGGVAANRGVRAAFLSVMRLGEDELIITGHHAVMGAIGAALAGLENPGNAARAEREPDPLGRLEHYLKNEKPAAKRLAPLARPAASPRREHRGLEGLGPNERLPVFLGIDVGSISTNVVLIDKDHQVVDREYLMTAGRPLEAIKQGLAAVGGRVGARVKVLGACTTGSGRYLTGDFVGADVVRNEITAQATAAAAIDPEVDTIFEIGGQDSKYISLSNGAIVDFMMNKACAAGTGSFLEEQAEKLGIQIKGEFGELALSAPEPVELGERCTVFMESDLVHHQQQGAHTPDLVAGLSYSIVTNYINKVVEDRPIGKKIFYQGATAFNQGIVAAFEAVTGRPITVPDHADVTGAIGAAILAQRERTWETSAFKGFDLSQRRYEVTSFECASCANACEIRKVSIEGEPPLFYGSRCDKYDEKKKAGAASGLPDLFAERMEMVFNPPEAEGGDGRRGRIGLPRAMFFHELTPFFKTFLVQLGFEPVLSEKSNKKLIHRGVEAVVNEPCFPVKAAHGHIIDLIEKGVETIFLPSVVNMAKPSEDFRFTKICPYSQTLTYTCRSAIDFEARGVRLIQGPVYFGEGMRVLNASMLKLAGPLGADPAEIRRAVKVAWQAQQNFEARLLARGRQALELLDEKGVPGMVVVSRPYNGFDPGINLNLSAKLGDLGVLGIPMDFLPLNEPERHQEAQHHYWRYAQKILAAAEIVRGDGRLNAIYITNFGCGPDSFILHFFRDIMRGKPYLEIEIDEHSSDVGAVTRLEAFLDSLKNVRVTPPRARPAITRSPVGALRKRTLFMPNMTDQIHILAAAFRAGGLDAEVLPPSDAETLRLGRKLTSGKECFPLILTTGDIAKLVSRPDFDPGRSALLMPSGTGPCRFGQYHRLQRLILNEMGLAELPIFSPDQNDELYDEANALGGREYTKTAWQGLVAADILIKKLLETRPYELTPGEADRAYAECLEDVCQAIQNHADIGQALRSARWKQAAVKTAGAGSRPVVGIVGEIYTRNNEFSNENTLGHIENLGGQVRVPPVTEWLLYLNQTFMANARRQRRWATLVSKKLINAYQEKKLAAMERLYQGFLSNGHEPPMHKTLDLAAPYLHRTFEGEAILSLGKAADYAAHGVSGIVNIIPFTCMPGNIVNALLKRFREDHAGIPVLNVSCDGQEQTNNLGRLEAFMHQVKQYHEEHILKD